VGARRGATGLRRVRATRVDPELPGRSGAGRRDRSGPLTGLPHSARTPGHPTATGSKRKSTTAAHRRRHSGIFSAKPPSPSGHSPTATTSNTPPLLQPTSSTPAPTPGSGADANRQPADYGADMCTPFEESSSSYLPLNQSGLLLGRLAEPKHGRLVRRIKAVGAVGRTRFRDG
jgi:hypothetical protein